MVGGPRHGSGDRRLRARVLAARRALRRGDAVTPPYARAASGSPGHLPTTPLLRRRRPRPREARVQVELDGAAVEVCRGRIEAFLRGAGVEVAVDEATLVVWTPAGWVRGDARPTEATLLLELVRSGVTGVSPRRLFLASWGRPLRNEYDRRALHCMVWRLRRRLLPALGEGAIETVEDRYRLHPGLRAARVRQPPLPDAEDPAELALAMARRGPVSCRGLRARVGRAASVVRRVLSRLVREGRLERIGAGRSTAYRIPREARRAGASGRSAPLVP